MLTKFSPDQTPLEPSVCLKQSEVVKMLSLIRKDLWQSWRGEACGVSAPSPSQVVCAQTRAAGSASQPCFPMMGKGL